MRGLKVFPSKMTPKVWEVIKKFVADLLVLDEDVFPGLGPFIEELWAGEG